MSSTEVTRELSCWSDVDDVLSAGVNRLLLYGPPGTGKTFAALNLNAEVMAERLVCTEDLTTGEITGTWVPTGSGQWQWREGPAIRAWRGVGGGGSRLVVDEVDRASGDALSTLLAVTDSQESARWRNPETGEWVSPGSDFSVIMTTNIEDLNDLPSSLADRFPVRIRIDQPRPEAVARLSLDLQEPALSGSLGPSDRRVSLRAFYAFDELRRVYGAQRAADLIFGPAVGSAILDALNVGWLK